MEMTTKGNYLAEALHWKSYRSRSCFFQMDGNKEISSTKIYMPHQYKGRVCVERAMVVRVRIFLSFRWKENCQMKRILIR